MTITSIGKYSLVPFLGRFFIGLYLCLNQHKRRVEQMSSLAEYPFVEQLGALVIYVAGQLWIILLSGIGTL